ncbi:MAG: four helix bundle protein [Sterolibacteriaceae bacterium]|nr:four helix bundle protein [Sterolibacteriaceae bacterium]MBK9086003.1 four helix bundle protein [Sterolibacteriaceae bacterium]
MSKIESHRDLKAWQKGMELAEEAYRLGKILPKVEEYRLTGQLLRAAASVPANIAEGHARGTRKDYANFVNIARGSLAETETFLLLAVRAGLIPAEQTARALTLTDELGKMLTVLRQRLNADPL